MPETARTRHLVVLDAEKIKACQLRAPFSITASRPAFTARSPPDIIQRERTARGREIGINPTAILRSVTFEDHVSQLHMGCAFYVETATPEDRRRSGSWRWEREREKLADFAAARRDRYEVGVDRRSNGSLVRPLRADGRVPAYERSRSAGQSAVTFYNDQSVRSAIIGSAALARCAGP